MKPITPYLFFNGNCREAMQFYQECIGGKLEIMTNADAPADACPNDVQMDSNQVMHACLTKDDFTLMASDNPSEKAVFGDNVSLSLQCESIQETQQIFNAMSINGKITMPLADTFWGAYFGMLMDQYGFHWMVNCPQSIKTKD